VTGKELREISREVIYDGRKVRLEVHQIEEADGRRATREIVRHNGSVAILALRRQAGGALEMLLERNYRYSVGDYVLEIPAGTLDRPGEEPLACARRELIEETGYRAAALRPLLAILPSPGLLTERLTIFVAEEVTSGPADPEPGEVIEVVWVPWAEVLRMVRDRKIEDAKTITAILYYELFNRGAGA
jgi:ADP-ribose pyrophosphatase